LRAQPGDDSAILEAFKPGNGPSEAYSVIGHTSGDGEALVSPDSERALRSGTGGLY
jgi:penicillin-binding protein 1A